MHRDGLRQLSFGIHPITLSGEPCSGNAFRAPVPPELAAHSLHMLQADACADIRRGSMKLLKVAPYRPAQFSERAPLIQIKDAFSKAIADAVRLSFSQYKSAIG